MPNVVIAPYLCVSSAVDAIAFYTAAFGAEELGREVVPTGEISHCRMRIGEATFYLADQYPQEKWLHPLNFDGHSVAMHIEVDDPDPLFERAVAAGATVTRPLASQDYGRAGHIVDPFGHHWTIIRINPEFGVENVPR
jgi:PhnB protein